MATGDGTSSAAATSMQMEDVLDDISDNDQDLGEADLCDFMDTSTIRSTPELLDRPCTRSTSALSAHEPIRSFLTTSTQTDSLSLDEAIFPKISTRKAAVVKGKVSTLIDPQILEAIVECETTARCSIYQMDLGHQKPESIWYFFTKAQISRLVNLSTVWKKTNLK